MFMTVGLGYTISIAFAAYYYSSDKLIEKWQSWAQVAVH